MTLLKSAALPDFVHARHWVAGAADHSSPSATRSVVNPATGTTIGDFPAGNSDMVELAVLAAAEAAPDWWALGAKERRRPCVDRGLRRPHES